MQKDLSFIIPIYNVAPYLAQCLDSIVSQTVSKEIILIDDGSIDNSFAIAQDYQSRHKDIILIKQHNGGVSAARNVGLRLATGRYVYFADPDDWILETRLDEMVKLADATQADMLKGMMQHSHDDGRPNIIRQPESPNLKQENQYETMTGFQHLHNMLRFDWLPSLCFAFYRRAFLLEHQLHFLDGARISEDQLLLVRFLTAHENVRVTEVSRLFYNYAHHENTATTKHDYVAGFESSFVQVAQALKQHHEMFVEKFASVYDNAPPRNPTSPTRFVARYGIELWLGIPLSIYAFQRRRQAASATFVHARNHSFYAAIFALPSGFIIKQNRVPN